MRSLSKSERTLPYEQETTADKKEIRKTDQAFTKTSEHKHDLDALVSVVSESKMPEIMTSYVTRIFTAII
jgi:hypothetical protein